MEELTVLDASTLKEVRDNLDYLIDAIFGLKEPDMTSIAYYTGRLEQLLIDALMKTPADSSDTKSGSPMTENPVTSHLIGTAMAP
jgi:hypothetical protein